MKKKIILFSFAGEADIYDTKYYKRYALHNQYECQHIIFNQGNEPLQQGQSKLPSENIANLLDKENFPNKDFIEPKTIGSPPHDLNIDENTTVYLLGHGDSELEYIASDSGERLYMKDFAQILFANSVPGSSQMNISMKVCRAGSTHQHMEHFNSTADILFRELVSKGIKPRISAPLSAGVIEPSFYNGEKPTWTTAFHTTFFHGKKINYYVTGNPANKFLLSVMSTLGPGNPISRSYDIDLMLHNTGINKAVGSKVVMSYDNQKASQYNVAYLYTSTLHNNSIYQCSFFSGKTFPSNKSILLKTYYDGADVIIKKAQSLCKKILLDAEGTLTYLPMSLSKNIEKALTEYFPYLFPDYIDAYLLSEKKKIRNSNKIPNRNKLLYISDIEKLRHCFFEKKGELLIFQEEYIAHQGKTLSLFEKAKVDDNNVFYKLKK